MAKAKALSLRSVLGLTAAVVFGFLAVAHHVVGPALDGDGDDGNGGWEIVHAARLHFELPDITWDKPAAKLPTLW